MMAWGRVLNMLIPDLILTSFLAILAVTPAYTLSPYDSRHLIFVLPPTDPCEARHLENQDRYICKEMISGTGEVKTELHCLPGWSGKRCQYPVCGKTCQHPSGRCIGPNLCQCHLGYQGSGCESCVKRPGCRHGSCKKPYECNCDPGYSGMFCSEPKCQEGCSIINGYCTKPLEACTCRQGWQGINCTECVPMPGCVKGGCFHPLECICLDGWTGTFCETPICKDSCHKKNGFCHQPGECICRPGYEGDLCDKCSLNPHCINGDCDKPWDCNCEDGWTGQLCDTPETQVFGYGPREGKCILSEKMVCENLRVAKCTFLGNGSVSRDIQPECVCARGFTGAHCEIEVKPKATETSKRHHNHEHHSGSWRTKETLKENENINNISDDLFLKDINKTTDNFIKVTEKERPVDDRNDFSADYGSIGDMSNTAVNLDEREGGADVEGKPLDNTTSTVVDLDPTDYLTHQNNHEEEILHYPDDNNITMF